MKTATAANAAEPIVTRQKTNIGTIAARLKAKQAAKKEQNAGRSGTTNAGIDAAAVAAAEQRSNELTEALRIADNLRAREEEDAKIKANADAEAKKQQREATIQAKLEREKTKQKHAAKAAGDAAAVAFNAAKAARSMYYRANVAANRTFKAHTMQLNAAATTIQRTFRQIRGSLAATTIQRKFRMFRAVQHTKQRHATEAAYRKTESHLHEAKALLQHKPFDGGAARNLLKRLYDEAMTSSE